MTMYESKQGLLPIFTRWWLKWRPCKRAVQINAGQGIPACIEFYVPWYAWPLEFIHRMIFGKTEFK